MRYCGGIREKGVGERDERGGQRDDGVPGGGGGVCFFGACCALYAALTLVWPGTALDALWAVNPAGHEGLLPLGRGGGVTFLGLAAVMVAFGWGWLHRRRWAWYGLVAGIPINMLGDAGQVVVGRWREGLFGVVAAGLVLVYLTRPGTRGRFG